jgi:flavin reductase (DIM6/NTAB) family NADH-FMN oxidoreductase RutF
MTKKVIDPRNAVYPCPSIMATCGDLDGVSNIITLAWAGNVASIPAMVAIGVRESRFSYDLIKNSGEFVINLPTIATCKAMDLCGSISGRDGDKFKASGLTKEKASKVRAPLIKECPVNIECVVRHVVKAGSHDVFLGEVVAIDVDEANTENGFVKPEEAIAYHARGYFSLKELVGTHGYSMK